MGRRKKTPWTTEGETVFVHRRRRRRKNLAISYCHVTFDCVPFMDVGFSALITANGFLSFPGFSGKERLRCSEDSRNLDEVQRWWDYGMWWKKGEGGKSDLRSVFERMRDCRSVCVVVGDWFKQPHLTRVR